MAGHSKFKNIQHRKGAQDKKRAKLFSKLAKEVTVAAKMGMPDPEHNPRLRTAITAARAQSMPKENIERAIKKSTEQGGENYEDMRYEGFGPGGIGVIVEALTDNRNRTVAEVRHAFTKHGGSMGTDGSVSYLFAKVGVLTFAPGSDEDQIMEAALDAGADDVISDGDGSIEVITEPESFASVVKAMSEAGLTAEDAEIIQRASTKIELDVETGAKVLKFLDILEDLDDTQEVCSNAEIPAEAYEA